VPTRGARGETAGRERQPTGQLDGTAARANRSVNCSCRAALRSTSTARWQQDSRPGLGFLQPLTRKHPSERPDRTQLLLLLRHVLKRKKEYPKVRRGSVIGGQMIGRIRCWR